MRRKENIKKNKNKMIFNSILVIIFLILGFMVRNSSEGILFDVNLLEFIHQSSNPGVFNLMKGLSFLGAEKFLVPFMFVIIIYNVLKKHLKEALFLLVNTLGSFGLNSLIKQVFQRTRPLDFALVKQGGLSYPSGHSMVVMSMYLALFYLLIRDVEDKKKKNIIAVAVGIYIASMGLSRMYLGVHWPTDIIGGYICGYLLYDISKRIIKE